jgi:hypothetical protein
MESGRFGCSRSLLAFSSLVLSCGSVEFKARGQQSPTSAPVENTVPALPAAKPLSETAAGTVPADAASAKPQANDASTASVTPAADNSSRFRLGAGDLLEVGVPNVPELSTKARIGNSGDVYLPPIDHVPHDTARSPKLDFSASRWRTAGATRVPIASMARISFACDKEAAFI